MEPSWVDKVFGFLGGVAHPTSKFNLSKPSGMVATMGIHPKVMKLMDTHLLLKIPICIMVLMLAMETTSSLVPTNSNNSEISPCIGLLRSWKTPLLRLQEPPGLLGFCRLLYDDMVKLLEHRQCLSVTTPTCFFFPITLFMFSCLEVGYSVSRTGCCFDVVCLVNNILAIQTSAI